MLDARLAAHHLAHGARSVTAVAERLLALQGQDLAAVKWALAIRAGAVTEADVEQAFASRALVRSWPLRGTLHVVPATELEWMRKLLFERNLGRVGAYHRKLGLDAQVLRKARAIAEKSLEPGPLTREQLFAEFEAGKVPTGQLRGVNLLWLLAQHGVICFGDFVDGDQRVALSASWIRKSRTLEGDEALAELAVRYFAGHGPATVKDLAWWGGLSQALARRGIEAAGNRLEQDGEVFSLSPRNGERVGVRGPRALLLPAFDEYFLGYQARDAVLDAKYFTRVVPGGNGVFQPLVVIDGRIVGTWKRKVDATHARLSLTPFTRFPARSGDELEAAAARYGSFLSRQTELSAAS